MAPPYVGVGRRREGAACSNILLPTRRHDKSVLDTLPRQHCTLCGYSSNDRSNYRRHQQRHRDRGDVGADGEALATYAEVGVSADGGGGSAAASDDDDDDDASDCPVSCASDDSSELASAGFVDSGEAAWATGERAGQVSVVGDGQNGRPTGSAPTPLPLPLAPPAVPAPVATPVPFEVKGEVQLRFDGGVGTPWMGSHVGGAVACVEESAGGQVANVVVGGGAATGNTSADTLDAPRHSSV